MVPRSSLAAVFAAALLAPAAAHAAPSVRVQAPEVVRTGDVIALKLKATGAAPRAFQAAASFDHRLAERNGLRVRSRAGDVQALGPVQRGNTEAFGAYAVGAAPAGFGTLELLAARPGVLRIALTDVRTVGAGGRAASAAGRTVLTVRIAGRSARVPRIRQRATVRLRAARAGAVAAVRRLDATGDAVLDRADAAELALRWGRAREAGGDACDARDVTGDGCLDVADVQRVADRSGGVRSAKPSRGRAAQAAPIVVTSTGDGDDTAADGTCQAADGACTLRAAITEANRQAGANRIEFAIPGDGVRTIQLGATLPTLSDTSGPTTIDGYTQPGAAPNTDALRSNAQVLVQVRGTGYTANGLDLFSITSAGNVVRGLATYDARRSFTLLGTGARDNVLAGNFIGTDASATAGATTPNLYGNGVVIGEGASANRIGGTDPADRNVISGNSRHGLSLYGIGTSGNLVQGNIVGLAPLGDRRLQNLKHGLDVNEGASNTLIGGTGPGERNVISGNGFLQLDDFTAGVEVSHMSETRGTKVVGNFFGTDVTGEAAPSYAFNSHYALRIEDQVNDVTVSDNVIVQSRQGAIKVDAPGTHDIKIANNRIGVTSTGLPVGNGVFGVAITWTAHHVRVGPGNIITGSPAGIKIGHRHSDHNTITRNSIHGNAGLGIDLEPWDAVSYNDAGDADVGTNEGLNYPYFSKASTAAASGTACAGCTVEVFRADGGSGEFGEGKDFLAGATADGAGKWTAPLSGVAAGEFLTSTATDAAGNTSEFSENYVVGDTTPPTTTALCNGSPCRDAAYPGSVTVSLTATDAGGAGVDSIRYTTDGTSPSPSSKKYTGPFVVTATTTVKFRAFDKSANMEPVRTQVVRIDPDAPKSTITCDGGPCPATYLTTPIEVALAATDDGGIEAIRYTTDGSEPTPSSPAYGGPFTVTETTTVKFRAYDLAGNAEAVQTQVVRTDTAAPVSTMSCNGSGCESAAYTSAVQVALAATDTGGSGLDGSVRYTLDGTDPTKDSTVYGGPFNVSQTTTVKFRAFDVAGNAESVQTKVVTVSAPAYFVRDEFERSTAGGLGSADAGGAWSVNAATRTSVSGGEAVLSNWTGANQDTHAWTATVRSDMEVLAQVRLNATDPVGASYQPRVVARAQADARNGYAARLVHTPSGGVSWGLSRMVNAGGANSALLGSGTLTTSGAAGTSWWIRLRVQGTSIRARFWQDGTPEPGTWRVATTDGYYASGRASLGALLNGGAASPYPRVGFASFSALDLAPA